MKPSLLYKVKLILPALPVILAVLALVGWVLDIDSLKRSTSSSVAMNPATAVCMIFLAFEAMRLNANSGHAVLYKAGQLAIIIVILSSAMKLSDFIFDTPFAIDQFIFSTKLDAEPGHPSRMAPNTAACFFILGWAMQFLRSRSDSSILKAQLLAMAAFLLALLALIGYIFDAHEVSGVAHHIPMAINTLLAFLLISSSVLLTYPQKGFMCVFTSEGTSGSIANILLPTSILVPLAFGWLGHTGEEKGFFNMEFALILTVIMNIVSLFFLSYFAARKLFSLDLARKQAEDALLKVDSIEIVSQQLKAEITERKQAERKLRDLATHLQSVREEEKASIAREIHDDLGGTLTTMKMETYWLKTELVKNGEASPLLDHAWEISKLIDHASGVMRSIITGLRPTLLDDLGLLAALEWQAEQFQKHAGIKCRVNCIGDKGGLDKSRAIELFRITQEALANVARHSGATSVEIEYHHNDEEIVLSIIDNGHGMIEERSDTSIPYGIMGMCERVDLMGGKINFNTPPDGGFDVTVILPPHAKKEEDT